MSTVAIVGAGPAGLRAAEQLVGAGLRPVLIDESPRVGGQIYRQPPPALQRPVRALYGFEAGKATALFHRFAQLAPQVDHRPDTLVWQIEGRTLHLLCGDRADSLAVDALILATGATDRVLPFPGWTLPGVFTLGAAQVALKAQASLVGPRVVFAGTGPLLYLVAWQYAHAGGTVQAVLDVAPPGSRVRALPDLLARPEVAAKGAYFLAQLRLAGVPVHQGAQLVRAEGNGCVQHMHWRIGPRRHVTACDAIAFGHGLRSETQLADLAGCAFEFSAIDQAWLPRQDAQGRSSVPGVYLAGDGAAILGADAAELSGARAARALLQDLGRPAPARDDAAAMAMHRRFRQGLEALCPLPADWAAQAPDDLIVCRCEEVTAGTLRACVHDTGTDELNRLKALTRIGMGRCQGRMCAPAAARLLAHAAGRPLAEVGRLRSQPPVKPVPVAVLGAAAAAVAPVPSDERDD
ncbi:NAD(P)/FAD-dependent oxidoreductase [Ideonella sp. A 288]|uniref:FAD/NAD(P)-dependent oxidoreductase n=1 Tax=Ideonella sp. A 288 TaxID=1962181 RepID=UPI000B4B803F|nr:FAD/NAD(P)-binding oxidoreductase [Ideonella sp. A 288]